MCARFLGAEGQDRAGLDRGLPAVSRTTRRLGREQIETAYALKQIITASVRVFYYLEDREGVLQSPTDKLLLPLTAFADEREREEARQRTHDALVRKARAGYVPGGSVYGYDNVEVALPDPVTGKPERLHIKDRLGSAGRRRG